MRIICDIYFAHIFLQICNMIIHKGELIEKAVRECSFPITLLAKRLNKSRRHIYNLFENPDVSLDIILEVGKIIQYDFSKELKELVAIPIEYQIDTLSKSLAEPESAAYWKSKYFELVEQHKRLLENRLKEYFTEGKKEG